MKKDVAQAWRNGLHYLELSDEQQAALPESPAGMIDVDDEALASISGACGCDPRTSAFCSPCPPMYCH